MGVYNFTYLVLKTLNKVVTAKRWDENNFLENYEDKERIMMNGSGESWKFEGGNSTNELEH